jgi:hypothetical protein
MTYADEVRLADSLVDYVNEAKAGKKNVYIRVQTSPSAASLVRYGTPTIFSAKGTLFVAGSVAYRAGTIYSLTLN